MKQFFFYISIMIGLIYSNQSHAFDLQFHYGEREIENNALFNSQDGKGIEQGGKFHFFLDKNKYTSVGAHYSNVDYDLSSDKTYDGITIEGSGSFSAEYYGPHVSFQYPTKYFTPYSSFSYILGGYTYSMKRVTNEIDQEDTNFESTFRTIVELESRGFQGSIGIRFGTKFGFFIERVEGHETLRITRIRSRTTNKVSGEVETSDGGEDSIESTFQSLINQKFDHSTKAILVGLDFQY